LDLRGESAWSAIVVIMAAAKLSIALIGDYSATVMAHQAIPRAIALAAGKEGLIAEVEWIGTRAITDAPRQLARFHAIWVVPASPYASADGAFRAIRWARESKRPLLASCGGFQHMVIDYARECAGVRGADHAETNPGADELVIQLLACSLVEQTGGLRFVTGSHIRRWYGQDTGTEGYRCNYGLNAAYRSRLEAAGLRFTAFDDEGEIRAAELPESTHPFYVGTLFQSERAALRGDVPPLARALLRAAAEISL
jgi:CTP synthase (UTP-ammonia lyase)